MRKAAEAASPMAFEVSNSFLKRHGDTSEEQAHMLREARSSEADNNGRPAVAYDAPIVDPSIAASQVGCAYSRQQQCEEARRLKAACSWRTRGGELMLMGDPDLQAVAVPRSAAE